jgi:2-polyprenyl-6-methoxyphenol hydroxylase-like FAD-dependent oxidoreductase
MRQVGSHAVVIGASMGGLLAARALHGPYERVTILDRDTIPDGPQARKGVPQGRHLHLLLSRGAEIMDAMFPGLLADLEAGGAPVARSWDRAWVELGGHQFALDDEISGSPVIGLTRPFLEHNVRERVRALPGVEIRDRTEATGLLATPGGELVTGVRAYGPQGAYELGADLVVDATGRTGRAPVWLKELGYAPARESSLGVDILYVSRRVKMPDVLGPLIFMGISPNPAVPRAVGMEAQEDGTWIVTAVGYTGDHPPMDDAGFDAYVSAAMPEHLAKALRDAEPVTEFVSHRYPANLRRRYELIRRFPSGFLVFGDALCSFNPLYGQGMTVASLQAQALRRCLLRPGADPAAGSRFARRFFAEASLPVANAWQMALGEDLALPGVAGRRSPWMRWYVFYVRHLKIAASRDPATAEAFLRVVRFLDPYPRLALPDVAARMLLAHLRPAPPEVPRGAA